MNEKSEGHPPGSKKPMSIHRRIVAYGLMLALMIFAFSLLISSRYQVAMFNNPVTVIRYDRWTGQVSLADANGAWQEGRKAKI